MIEDAACQRVLADMIKLEIIDKDKEDEAWPYFKHLFTLGYDEGNAQQSKRKPVLQSTLDDRPVKIHLSIKDAASKSGLDVSTIHRAAKGKFKTAGGYKWKFVNKRDG